MTFRFHSRNHFNIGEMLILIWFVSIIILPRSNNLFLVLIYCLTFVLFLLSCFNRNCGGIVTRRSGALYLLVISFVVALIDVFMFGIVSGCNTFFRYLTMYLGAPLFCYVDCMLDDDGKKRIEKKLFAFWICVCLLQLYLYINNSSLEYARGLASETQSYFTFVRDAYGVCIGSILIACTLLEKLLAEHKGKYLISFIICSLLIYFTKSTIFLLVYVGIVFYILVNSLILKNHKHVIASRIVLLLLIGSFIIFHSNIGQLFIQLSGNISGIVGYRLKELGLLLVYRDISLDAGSRFDLYTLSIRSFLAHPLIGSYVFSNSNINEFFGNHSEWLDILGRYGLLLGAPLICWIYYNLVKDIRISDRKNSSHVLVIFLAGMLDPIAYFSSMFALFFIVPGINKDWY